MPSFHHDGLEFFYADRGHGEPVVFVNGLSGDHLYWNAQLRALSKRYRAIAIDNRDVGQSSYAEADYDIRTMAGDLLALFEHLDLPPVHLVGLSMGGMIAQEATLQQPDRVRSLALVDSAGVTDEWFTGTVNAFELIRKQVEDTPAFFKAILPWWVSYRFLSDPDRVSWLHWVLERNPHPQSLDGFSRHIRAIRSHDALDRLSQIHCPVLVMAGEDDNVLPVRYSRQLCEYIPQARLIILPGIGHAPAFEDAALFNRHLFEYLDSQSSQQRQTV